MDRTIKTLFENLRDEDKDVQYEALMKLFDITNDKVNWTYEAWDQLLKDLTEGDNHQKSRAAQLLCNLAKSDPKKEF